MKNNYLAQAWLVLGLALCFGAALAGIDAVLTGQIDANKLRETVDQIPSLVDGAAGGEKTEVGGRTVYRAADSSGRQVGWVVPGRGGGFADKIELLIGLDAKATTITGLYVLTQKETPGLGGKIVEEAWVRQFVGKTTTLPLSIKKDFSPGENEIRSVTGATISSRSVTAIVNETVEEMRKQLSAAAE